VKFLHSKPDSTTGDSLPGCIVEILKEGTQLLLIGATARSKDSALMARSRRESSAIY
jgi:hypothetical protein